jgi:hypothetical protein
LVSLFISVPGGQRLDFALEQKGIAPRMNDEPTRGSDVGACRMKAP